jgi:GGDEF domain-containing protein
MTPTSQPARHGALADAARIAGASDLLLVHARGHQQLTLSEGLIAGEHWRMPFALDAAVEPLVRQALAGTQPIRCPAGQRRRVVGPYWATDAVLVPYHDQRGSTIVILGAFLEAPTDGAVRYAAAAVRALFPAEEPPPHPSASPVAPQRRMTGQRDAITGLLNREGWDETLRRRAAGGDGPHAILVVDVAVTPAADAAVMRRVAAAVRANARSTDLVCRLGPTEIAVLMRGGDIGACMETADRVRTLLNGDPSGPPVTMGWSAVAEADALPHALEVARAMVGQERRARAGE